MRRRKYYEKRRGRKRGRGIPYTYKNKVYLGKKPQTGTGYWCSFKNYSAFPRKRWRRNWTLMIRKKYKRKTNRKYKRKYKRKIHGRGVFGDACRTLGSFGKLWYKSLGGK